MKKMKNVGDLEPVVFNSFCSCKSNFPTSNRKYENKFVFSARMYTSEEKNKNKTKGALFQFDKQ